MENYCNFKPFDKVLVRYDNQHEWQIDFFSHYVHGVECPYKCLTRDFNQCIPYEGHEHLIDTTSEPSLPKQTEQSQTQTKENKMEEDCDNYGYPVEYFERNDVVLCRDAECEEWSITSFVAKGNEQYPFQGHFYRWKNCIPYEGNEHLLGTADAPERYDPNKNTLFGIKLKPGYVLEFEDDEIGILFPTANGFAVSYAKGLWQFLKGIKKDSIVRILGITQTDYLRSGELLWEKPKKQTFTKAEIAERLGMNVQDFEIIDEDNEENE